MVVQVCTVDPTIYMEKQGTKINITFLKNNKMEELLYQILTPLANPYSFK